MISLLARMLDRGHVRLILTSVWGVLIFLAAAAASRPEATIEILLFSIHWCFITIFSFQFIYKKKLFSHMLCVSWLCCLQVSSKNLIFCFVWQINKFWRPAFPGKNLKHLFFSFLCQRHSAASLMHPPSSEACRVSNVMMWSKQKKQNNEAKSGNTFSLLRSFSACNRVVFWCKKKKKVSLCLLSAVLAPVAAP